jgi:hypothetical protein
MFFILVERCVFSLGAVMLLRLCFSFFSEQRWDMHHEHTAGMIAFRGYTNMLCFGGDVLDTYLLLSSIDGVSNISEGVLL